MQSLLTRYATIVMLFCVTQNAFSQVESYFKISDMSCKDTVDVELRFTKFDSMLIFQFGIAWDTNQLEAISVQKTDALSSILFNLQQDEGLLRVLWDDPTTQGVTLPDTAVFIMKFLLVAKPLDTLLIRFANDLFSTVFEDLSKALNHKDVTKLESKIIPLYDEPIFIDSLIQYHCDSFGMYYITIPCALGDTSTYHITAHQQNNPLQGSFVSSNVWKSDWIPNDASFTVALNDKHDCTPAVFSGKHHCITSKSDNINQTATLQFVQRKDGLHFRTIEPGNTINSWMMSTLHGNVIARNHNLSETEVTIQTQYIPTGIYTIIVQTNSSRQLIKCFVL